MSRSRDLRLAKLYVPVEAKPCFWKPRPVPYAIQDKVKGELDRLVKRGILTKVDTSDWASPIVVVKADRSLRLCGDYKVSVNRVIDINQYPLPTAEDLFATLSGGKMFNSKIDLSSAYLQLELEDDCKKYLTINTQNGLYQFNRLAFGVASAPAIFQCTMDRILQGIPNVCCYLDDI